MGFRTQLERSWSASNSMLCVGLDPDPNRLPAPLVGAPDAIERFCREIVDATADLVCAFKPQFAYFASQRAEPALERICTYIRERYPDVTLILDAKRGDIGSTAQHYAIEAFDRYGAHTVTVNPYLGTDAVTPFLTHRCADDDSGGAIVLCRTSNPGGDDFQSLSTPTADGTVPLYLNVAARVADEWSQIGDCGLVIGATYPDELAHARTVAPNVPFLVPGVGAQGGDAATVVAQGADTSGRGLIVSSSRAVLYASSGDDFADAARAEAMRALAALRPTPPSESH